MHSMVIFISPFNFNMQDLNVGHLLEERYQMQLDWCDIFCRCFLWKFFIICFLRLILKRLNFLIMLFQAKTIDIEKCLVNKEALVRFCQAVCCSLIIFTHYPFLEWNCMLVKLFRCLTCVFLETMCISWN